MILLFLDTGYSETDYYILSTSFLTGSDDDDDDDDDPKIFFKSAKNRVCSNWRLIFSCYWIQKIVDKIRSGKLCS